MASNGTYRKRHQNHRFPADFEKELTKLYTLDNWHGPLAVLEDYFFLAIFIALPYLLGGETYSLAWWLIYACFTVPLVGTRMRALATCLHESAHKTMAKHPLLNFVLGTFCSGYLIFQGWYSYVQSHVKEHHGRFGGNEIDPDYKFQLEQGNYEPQSEWQFTLRNIVAPLLLLKTPAKLLDLFKNRFYSSDEPRWERITKLLYVGAIIGLVIYFGLGLELLLFWIMPFLTSFTIIGFFIEMFEHYPLMKGDKDLHMSRNRWSGFLGKFLLGIHNENYHLVHHLRPHVPFWNVRRAHLLMMNDPEYRAVQQKELGYIFSILPGVPSIFQRMIYGDAHASSENAEPEARKSKAAESCRFAILLDESLPCGVAGNVTAHLSAQLGAERPEIAGTEISDFSGNIHSGIPVCANVILSMPQAVLRERLAKARTANVDGTLLLLDFTKDGFETSTEEQYHDRLAKTAEQDLHYYGCAIFGPATLVRELTCGLNLLRQCGGKDRGSKPDVPSNAPQGHRLHS